jgi:two-component sensor histidine kinase
MLVTLGWSDEVAYDAMLVVSELVSNAICHGAEPIRLEVQVRPHELKVAVSDAAATEAVAAQPASTDGLGGRGLALVAAVAEAWGEQHHPDDGKTIWAQLRLPAGPASPAALLPGPPSAR